MSEKRIRGYNTHRSSLSFSLVERLARLCGIFCDKHCQRFTFESSYESRERVRGSARPRPVLPVRFLAVQVRICASRSSDGGLYTSIMALEYVTDHYLPFYVLPDKEFCFRTLPRGTE